MIELGQLAPTFELPNQNGDMIKLSDFLGSWIVLYFYPRALTPGCSQQTSSLEENIEFFNTRNSVVLGVSPDNSAKQLKFAEKYGVSFSLLADENAHVATKYGVWQKKSMYGKEYMGIVRTTFIIAPDGHVAAVINKPKPSNHTKVVMEKIGAIAGTCR